MKLDIFLRTHDKGDVHSDKNGRYCGATKFEVIKRCVSSIIKSTNNVYNHDIKITCLDDHSSPDLINVLNNIFEKSIHSNELIHLEQHGNNASLLYQLELCKNSDADLVYLLEDDYLHCETAVEEMLENYEYFKLKLNREIAFHPYDDPDNYKDRYIDTTRIVLGSKRHWRLNSYSTGTFMVSPSIIRKNYDIYKRMFKFYMTPYGLSQNIHEGTTINKIWREQVYLFTPIPSVALHMQFEAQRDKFLDWKSLWDKSIL